MNFGQAIAAMKDGKRVTRQGWNGRGMYVFLTTDVQFTTNADMSEFFDPEGSKTVEVSDMLVLRTAQATLQPGWLATQSDVLAEDWMIVE